MSARSLSDPSQPVFGWPVRVYIEDTDAGGVVFYANYLRYLERARTEYIRSLGFERVIVTEAGINYVVHSLSIQYRKPALLDDQLYVTAQVVERGQTFLRFHQQVLREPSRELLVSAEVKIACVDQALRPRRLPAELVEAMGRHHEAVQA